MERRGGELDRRGVLVAAAGAGMAALIGRKQVAASDCYCGPSQPRANCCPRSGWARGSPSTSARMRSGGTGGRGATGILRRRRDRDRFLADVRLVGGGHRLWAGAAGRRAAVRCDQGLDAARHAGSRPDGALAVAVGDRAVRPRADPQHAGLGGASRDAARGQESRARALCRHDHLARSAPRRPRGGDGEHGLSTSCSSATALPTGRRSGDSCRSPPSAGWR